MDPFTGMIIGSALTGLAGLFGQREQNDANAGQAQKQMDFQERMAGTQYQRGVKDLEAAGLNPAMAYGGAAAPSPAGAMAPMGNVIQAGMSGASTAMGLAQQFVNVQKTEAEARSADSQARIAYLDRLGADRFGPEKFGLLRMAGLNESLGRSGVSLAEIDRLRQEIGFEKQLFPSRFAKAGLDVEGSTIENMIKGLSTNRFRAESEYFGHPIGRAMQFITPMASSAGQISQVIGGPISKMVQKLLEAKPLPAGPSVPGFVGNVPPLY